MVYPGKVIYVNVNTAHWQDTILRNCNVHTCHGRTQVVSTSRQKNAGVLKL